MSLTLSSDHRVVDGARAAAFMHDLVGMLLEPQQSLLLP
jgi:pyruvate/2-oxoglutarate dehydrogenase complex dihydrolipoamide acyltransferase (E2) component